MLTSVTLPLLVFASSMLLACGVGLRLFMPRIPWSTTTSRLGALVFGGSATLLAVGEYYVRGDHTGLNPAAIPLTSLLVVAVAALICGLFLSTHAWWRTGVPAVRQPILWGILVVCVGMSGWSYSQLARAAKPRYFAAADRIELGKLLEVPHVYGETDLGRRVNLLHYEGEDLGDAETIAAIPPLHGGVERAKPSDASNCHGWIFTGGQHFVSGDSIPSILEGNGYLPVTDPLPDDLIVYWDDHGNVLHTGLVRGKLNDGIIMIESKFGVGARFLHMPEDQPYSANFEYYRTSRGGHLLTIRNEAQTVRRNGK